MFHTIVVIKMGFLLNGPGGINVTVPGSGITPGRLMFEILNISFDNR